MADDRAVALLETTTLDGETWGQETHYLIWSRGTGIDHVTDVHSLGAFTNADHEAAFTNAGLIVEFLPDGLLGRGLFIGTHAS